MDRVACVCHTAKGCGCDCAKECRCDCDCKHPSCDCKCGCTKGADCDCGCDCSAHKLKQDPEKAPEKTAPVTEGKGKPVASAKDQLAEAGYAASTVAASYTFKTADGLATTGEGAAMEATKGKMGKAFEMLKGEALDTALRTGASQATRRVREVVIAAMKRAAGKDKKKRAQVEGLEAFLNTEMGESMLKAVLAVGAMAVAKTDAEGKPENIPAHFAKEFRIQAMHGIADNGIEMVAGPLMAMLTPMIAGAEAELMEGEFAAAFGATGTRVEVPAEPTPPAKVGHDHEHEHEEDHKAALSRKATR